MVISGSLIGEAVNLRNGTNMRLFSNRLVNTSSEMRISEIISQVLAGRTALFELIMRRYNNRLFRIARSICQNDDEAMDVVQDSWINIYHALGNFEGEDKFPSWISKVTKNTALMHLRKTKRARQMSEYEDDKISPINRLIEQPENRQAQGELKQTLASAIELLPMHYRLVFVLRAVQELSTKETAASLEISEDVVKQRYLRAKRMLRDHLDSKLEQSAAGLYEFAGERCDRIVANVLEAIS